MKTTCRRSIFNSIILAGAFLPAVAFAASPNLANLDKAVKYIINTIIAPLPAIIIALAFIVFIWGMTMFIRSTASETDIKKGRDLAIWGIIALFVMISIWGLLGILVRTFNLSPPGDPTPEAQKLFKV